MVGHARPANRNSEVVISNMKTYETKAILTTTPRKLTRQILEIAQQRGWVITWKSGFQEARDTIGRNSYRLERAGETRTVDCYFPIPGDLYLGAM